MALIQIDDQDLADLQKRIAELEQFKTDTDPKLLKYSQDIAKAMMELGAQRSALVAPSQGITDVLSQVSNKQADMGVTLDTDGTMTANSDTRVASQKSTVTKIFAVVAGYVSSILQSINGFQQMVLGNTGVGNTNMFVLNNTGASNGIATPNIGTSWHAVLISNTGVVSVATAAQNATIVTLTATGVWILFLTRMA